MYSYRFTPDAQSDLRAIRRYTQEQWGEQQSQQYLHELRITLRLLCENPMLGKARPDVAIDVYSFPYMSHVLYYRILQQQLIVFGVLHKCMIPQGHLGERTTEL